jgi:hypothetical protein
MLPARGPRPTLKGETVLSLRLMDDVQLPQVASAAAPRLHSFSARPRTQSFGESESSTSSDRPALAIRSSVVTRSTEVSAAVEIPRASYASFVSTSAVSAVPAVVPSKPVFILNSGTVLAVGSYQYLDGRITYTLEHGGGGVVSTDEVDWNATTRVNNERGVRVTLHSGRVAGGTPGL